MPSEFIIKLKVALSDAKLNKGWRRERMILYFRDQDIRAEALEEGRELGRDEARREMILALLADGVDHQIICRSASITEEELDILLQEVSA